MYLSKKDEPYVETASALPENMVLIPAGKVEMGSNDTESFYEQLVYMGHVDAFMWMRSIWTRML